VFGSSCSAGRADQRRGQAPVAGQQSEPGDVTTFSNKIVLTFTSTVELPKIFWHTFIQLFKIQGI